MNLNNGFESFFSAIENAQSEAEQIQAALDLAKHYESLLGKFTLKSDYADTEETFLEGGVALASQYALDCLRDPLRTTGFIAGTYEAVKDKLAEHPGKPVNLLYAGCGPAAPLVLPFLHRFDPAELRIHLMDITATSLKAVQVLIPQLQLESYIEAFILADAITYVDPRNEGFDIIVSETMDKGLTREPQVRVMQNLVSQLAPNGIFIPEAITLYGELTFYGKEPYFDLGKDLDKLPSTYQTEFRQEFFTIDKAVYREPGFSFTSEVFKVPKDLSKTPDAAVFAEVKIYQQRVLPKAKSLLSNSFCIHSLLGREDQEFRFSYKTEGTPGWELLYE